MDDMVKQTIETEVPRTEKISILIDALQATTINEGVTGLNEAQYTSAWTESEREIIKEQMLILISEL